VQRVLITGGAGFIGSNLADRLLADGVQVVAYDNFSTGRHEFLEGVLTHPYGEVVKGDVLDGTTLRAALDGCDTVFHLQANADVRHGLEHPRRDLEQNAMATSELLEAMRAAGVTRMGFASSGSVYGEPDRVPTPEDAPMPIQTSLYGASKVAGEGTLHAYCHGFGFTGVVFRFVSILGERYTHGHVIDFYRALRADPSRLRVLGDGRQRKSYIYVGDCVQECSPPWPHTRSPATPPFTTSAPRRRWRWTSRSRSSPSTSERPPGSSTRVAREGGPATLR
jgi:UDP-glucose 4-epimerase